MKGKKYPKWRSLHDEGCTRVARVRGFRLRVEMVGSFEDWAWTVMTSNREEITYGHADDCESAMDLAHLNIPD